MGTLRNMHLYGTLGKMSFYATLGKSVRNRQWKNELTTSGSILEDTLQGFRRWHTTEANGRSSL